MISLISILILLIYVIISVALITLAERKIMAILQRRIGPNNIGYLGLMQPFSDGIKLIIKETILPSLSNKFLFLFSPFLIFFLSLLNWAIIPLSSKILITELTNSTILILIAISELEIFGVLYSGWSAYSKYAFLGGIRSTAQMLSYAINISLIMLCLVITNSSFNIIDYFNQPLGLSFLCLFPLSILFFICIVAESNRAPFDLPEAESEQVAGFMTEHGAVSFAFFFQGEYTTILTFTTLFFIYFFGFFINIPMLFIIIWLRASLPRFRFDQLIFLGWKSILPLIISFLLILPLLI